MLDALMTAGRGSRLQQSQSIVWRAPAAWGFGCRESTVALAVFVDPDKQNHASASQKPTAKFIPSKLKSQSPPDGW